ncbi:TetR family transcriptional regulator C-terminal domain-containing protein [Seohaeicola zhoushanensis]|uniref:TetR family transcriptional regulator n=1 Tax=Seohaeicola zhoushanensis TaxID=1569283 RepID=A0A8J3GXG9_9RHOB|nr:TetR family transcriptional regulator C-terminal domain-containing protein [Seohaeicola zhoushanensis]GHF53630.1 TetR family transcriptional regulator [Seohaeicola zhoushanensis]
MSDAQTDPPRQRRERKQNADKRRRQVLDATYRSIVSNGLQRTTLATVAAEAGLSQGVAVFYFKSKKGLLSEALRDLYLIYEAHWQEAVEAAGDDPAAQLVALVKADFDPKICNPAILSVWFAFWGEQKFTPQYGEITREFDDNRQRAIQGICARMLPDDPEHAADVADWVDTLTDGYWQNLHLFPASYSNRRACNSTLRALAALMPEYRDQLTPAD